MPPIPVLASVPAARWELPTKGLSVFYGLPEASRLFHYFLPHAILQGRQVLCLDGANRFDPLLLARFARERQRDPSEFDRRIRIARAFTCFQLTELLVRLPRLLQTFPAQIAIVTALPDLYFDEDVREREAICSFQRALQSLQAARAFAASHRRVYRCGVFLLAPAQVVSTSDCPGRSRVAIFRKGKRGHRFKQREARPGNPESVT
jgi:hypothetical protein